MNAPQTLFVFRWLVRDTFRQSLATRTFWLILGLSGLCILLCLSVNVEGAAAHVPPGEIELFGADRQPYTGLNPGSGRMTIGFGALRLGLFRDGQAEVQFFQSLLVKWGGSVVGLLLVLLWTSGFLPEFLHPTAASVLLAKPAPRWVLLTGKAAGVVVFVILQVTVFILGTWLALGWRVGAWNPGYLIAIPLLVLQFSILYSFSALLAVWSRNAIVCVFGALLMWSLCAVVNFGRHKALADTIAGAETAAAWHETAYWVLPKPADLTYLLDEALQTSKHFRPLAELQSAHELGRLTPELSILTTLVSALLLLGLAAWRFTRIDY